MKQNNEITVALIGNPNTGKTSLLNALTGLSLHVGNWTGKTIEKREGKIEHDDRVLKIVDLPGTYSLAPYSEEEKITREFLENQDTDIIVQTVDVNTLERNLLLTMELLALGKKLILAFNFNEEAKARGVKMDIDKIRKALQVPIVKVEAQSGINKEYLLKEIIGVHKRKYQTPSYIEGLKKSEKEIRHSTTAGFIRKEISPLCDPISDGRSVTDRIDSIVLDRVLAWPIFFAVIYMMFKLVFLISSPLISLLNLSFNRLGVSVYGLDLPRYASSFVVEGLLDGVGTVIAFMPLIFMLFLAIAALEDSGYLSRTVVIFDSLFRRFGISGRSFIPMIMGFGCNVPAVMAARTIRSKKERLIAISIAPFISCSARLPVYLLLAGLFFHRNTTFVILILYLFGIMLSLVVGSILSRLIKSTGDDTLIIELPPYRSPSLKNVVKHAWYETRSFVRRVGSIIFAVVVLTWLLASFPLGVSYASEESILARIGMFLAPVLEPLGFGSWPFAVALLLGFSAKENAIGILGTISQGAGHNGLFSFLQSHMTPLSSLSFIFFVLLYVPCLATVLAVKRETGSWLFAGLQIVSSLLIAWIVSFSVYQIGLLLGFA